MSAVGRELVGLPPPWANTGQNKYTYIIIILISAYQNEHELHNARSSSLLLPHFPPSLSLSPSLYTFTYTPTHTHP